jgi:hypothetical protein
MKLKNEEASSQFKFTRINDCTYFKRKIIIYKEINKSKQKNLN